MTHKDFRVAVLLAVLLLGAAGAAAQAPQYGPGEIVQTAPLYLYADASKPPLEALAAGTRVTVLEIEGDWLLIEFQHPRWGVRQGYVKANFVRPLSPRGAGAGQPAEGQAKPAQPGAMPAPRAGTAKPAAPSGGGWKDRGYVFVNGAYQAGGSSFSETFTFDKYLEQASIETDYPAKNAPGFDAAGAYRAWKSLAVGVAVSYIPTSTTGSVSGTIPHPFHYDTPRPVSGTAAIDRSETAVHVLAAWVVPVGRKIQLTLSGGPSIFMVSQSLVDSAPYDEAYPYDEATLRDPVVTDVSKTAVGFNAGLDVGYYFTPTVGVGGGVRFARATVDLPIHGSSVSTDAGGVQALVGLRFRVPPAKPKAVKPRYPAPPPPPKK